MAVLSTLRFAETISAAHQHSQTTSQSSEDQILYNAENSMAPPLALDQSFPNLPSTFGTGLHTSPTQFDGHSRFHAGRGPRQTPTDGGKEHIWMCSNCGDGPIGIWQSCCTSCGHAKCGACTVEEV
jgi:hypothetical protein